MEKMDKTVRFSIIIVWCFIVKNFFFVSPALTNCNLFSVQEKMVVME